MIKIGNARGLGPNIFDTAQKASISILFYFFLSSKIIINVPFVIFSTFYRSMIPNVDKAVEKDKNYIILVFKLRLYTFTRNTTPFVWLIIIYFPNSLIHKLLNYTDKCKGVSTLFIQRFAYDKQDARVEMRGMPQTKVVRRPFNEVIKHAVDVGVKD